MPGDNKQDVVVQDYIGWSGSWASSSPDQATGYNAHLADVISEGASAGAARVSPAGAPVQEVPLRLAVVGAPFAGKTCMALKLADDYGCKACPLIIHDIDDSIQHAC